MLLLGPSSWRLLVVFLPFLYVGPIPTVGSRVRSAAVPGLAAPLRGLPGPVVAESTLPAPTLVPTQYQRPSHAPASVSTWWRPLGTMSGVPETGSVMTSASRSKTLATRSASTTSRGAPAATTLPRFMAIMWSA